MQFLSRSYHNGLVAIENKLKLRDQFLPLPARVMAGMTNVSRGELSELSLQVQAGCSTWSSEMKTSLLIVKRYYIVTDILII